MINSVHSLPSLDNNSQFTENQITGRYKVVNSFYEWDFEAGEYIKNRLHVFLENNTHWIFKDRDGINVFAVRDRDCFSIKTIPRNHATRPDGACYVVDEAVKDRSGLSISVAFYPTEEEGTFFSRFIPEAK